MHWHAHAPMHASGKNPIWNPANSSMINDRHADINYSYSVTVEIQSSEIFKSNQLMTRGLMPAWLELPALRPWCYTTTNNDQLSQSSPSSYITEMYRYLHGFGVKFAMYLTLFGKCKWLYIIIQWALRGKKLKVHDSLSTELHGDSF